MLMALNQQNLINAEFAKRNKKYLCPICHELVILKHGSKMIAHFAHHTASNCVGSEGETQLHLRGKQQLFHDLIRQYPKIKLEVYLIALKQSPDLLTAKLAFEYQCSPITNRRLKERGTGYQSQQINSIWILGMDYFKKSLQADAVLRFLRYQRYVGFYLLFLDASQHCYYLKYRITQIGNQVVCKLKKFATYQALIKFMKKLQIVTYPRIDLIKLTHIIETELRWQSANILKLQQLCYENGHLLSGCPLITHYPILNTPIMKRNWLAWKIKIILVLEKQQSCKLSDLLELVEYEEYLFIKSKNPTLSFLDSLKKAGYVNINDQNVQLIKNFVWYRDTYDKIDAIKKMKKRSADDS